MAGEMRKVPGGPATVNVGAGLATVTPGGVLYATTTATTNVTTGETVLATYTLLANTLSVDGKGLRITAAATHAANTNGVTVRLYFGSTVILLIANATSGALTRIVGEVVRTGATTQVAGSQGQSAAANLATLATAPAETLAGPVVIKVTATGVASADMAMTYFLVEALA